MKKIHLVYLMFILVGCSYNDEPNVNIVIDSKIKDQFEVTYDQALNNALSILATLDTGNESRNLSSQRSVLTFEKITLVDSKSRSELNTTKYYLFNFVNNSGFALVSADKRDSVRVYLASERGHINASNLTDGSSISFLIDKINQYKMRCCELQDNHFLSRGAPEDDYTFTTNSYNIYKIGPLLSTIWDQGYPYNIYIGGRNPMGCGPIALSQIFTYYQAPNSAYVGGVNYVYDWNTISQVKSAVSIYDDSKIREVSKFIYSVGVASGANYERNDVGVNIYNVRNTIVNTFGYKSSDVKDYSSSEVVNSLNHNRLVYMRGDNASVGHAWVVDGCSEIKTEYRAYDVNGNLVENTVLNDYVYDHYHKYLHLNLGWGGMYNNNYNYSYEYNSSIDYRVWVYSDIFSFGGQEFNNDLKIICNIYY